MENSLVNPAFSNPRPGPIGLSWVLPAPPSQPRRDDAPAWARKQVLGHFTHAAEFPGPELEGGACLLRYSRFLRPRTAFPARVGCGAPKSWSERERDVWDSSRCKNKRSDKCGPWGK